MDIAKITSKGQITIPIAIRKLLGLKAGDKILFIQDGDYKVTMMKAAQPLFDAQEIFKDVAEKAEMQNEEDDVHLLKERKQKRKGEIRDVGFLQKLVYPAIFRPFEQGDGYTVEVPDLPGCVTEGASLADAILMGEDAASGWVLDELENGRPIPSARSSQDIRIGPGEFVNLLVLDIDSYAEKYGNKTVRKELTIPAWLNTFAENRQINFSKVLTEALSTLYQKLML